MVVNGLRVRDEPSTDSEIKTVLQAGMDVRVMAGPEEAGGMSWYQIVRGGLSGWVAAGPDGEPWLVGLANGLIAYADADDGISGFDPVTRDVQKLVSGGGTAGHAANPAWSPTGTELLFLRGNQVWLRDGDGNEMPLAQGDGGSWSPDGTQVLHQRRFGFEPLNVEIFVMRSDGTEAHNLTNRELADFSPLWSPDGRRILFHGGTELWVMNRDGSQLRQLTQSGIDGLSVNPVWEPDSTHVAFATRRPTEWELRRVNIETLEETALSPGMYPNWIGPNWIWSPDGTLYAVFGLAIELRTLDGELQSSLPLPEGHSPIRTGVWSPDGRFIAVPTGVSFTETKVVIVPLDGSQVVVVEGQPTEVISWQPVLEPL